MSTRAPLDLTQVTVDFSERDRTCFCWINSPEPQGTDYGSHLSLLRDSLSAVVGSAFLYRQAAESDQDCPYSGGADNEVLATGAAIAFSRIPALSSSAGDSPVKFHRHENAEDAYTTTQTNQPWVTIPQKYKPSSIGKSDRYDYAYNFGANIYALTGVSPETKSSFAPGSVMPDVNGGPGMIKGRV